jgi:hypothetical protein
MCEIFPTQMIFMLAWLLLELNQMARKQVLENVLLPNIGLEIQV